MGMIIHASLPRSSVTNITLVSLNSLEHITQAYARISAFLKLNLRGLVCSINSKLGTIPITITFAKSIQTVSFLPITMIGHFLRTDSG